MIAINSLLFCERKAGTDFVGFAPNGEKPAIRAHGSRLGGSAKKARPISLTDVPAYVFAPQVSCGGWFLATIELSACQWLIFLPLAKSNGLFHSLFTFFFSTLYSSILNPGPPKLPRTPTAPSEVTIECDYVKGCRVAS